MVILRVWWFVVFGLLGTMPTSAQQKPNVIFILADNVGYGDLGVYGGGELRGAPVAVVSVGQPCRPCRLWGETPMRRKTGLLVVQ